MKLLINLILSQDGFPIANLKGDVENRLQNYRVLKTAQKENNKYPFYKIYHVKHYRNNETNYKTVS